jgi:ferredoxin--NADP+ reductase
MLTELLSSNHRGNIVLITCVRRKMDLAYAEVHRELERRYSNYRYLALTTREPENVDPTHPTFIGKRYLQDYFRSGDFERDARVKLSPADTHVFLCGSPAMIGSAHLGTSTKSQSLELPGMVDVLEQCGFRLDRPAASGNIHTERYW